MPTTTTITTTIPSPTTAFIPTRQHFPKSTVYTTAGAFAACLFITGTTPTAMAETQKLYYGAAPDATHPWAGHDADHLCPRL